MAHIIRGDEEFLTLPSPAIATTSLNFINQGFIPSSMRIAIPSIATSMDEALRDMDGVAKVSADAAKEGIEILVELRIDYMVAPQLERLLRHVSTPKIVTNRHPSERGKFQGSEPQRISYLQEAIDLGAEYVDIEVDHYHPLERRPTTKLIVSNHDFARTPKDLERIYRRILEKQPNIVKIATMFKQDDDNRRMLDLIALARSEGREVIGLCMGKEGQKTRYEGPRLGGYLTFGVIDQNKASASGQPTVAQLREAWKNPKLIQEYLK